MRVLLPVFLCILIVCGIADSQSYQTNFVSGERQEGDYIVTNRTIFKPTIPWLSMRATIGVTASESEIITCVTVTSLVGNEFLVQVLNSSSTNLLVIAQGKLGEGLYLSVEGYAKYIPTTPATITTDENDDENNEQDSDNENNSESNAGNEEGDDTEDGDTNAAEGDDG